MSEYKPVTCAFHSELELSILQRVEISLRWRKPGGELVQARVRPLDLVTRNSEEFLLIQQENGQQEEIRLDYVELLQKI